MTRTKYPRRGNASSPKVSIDRPRMEFRDWLPNWNLVAALGKLKECNTVLGSAATSMLLCIIVHPDEKKEGESATPRTLSVRAKVSYRRACNLVRALSAGGFLMDVKVGSSYSIHASYDLSKWNAEIVRDLIKLNKGKSKYSEDEDLEELESNDLENRLTYPQIVKSSYAPTGGTYYAPTGGLPMPLRGADPMPPPGGRKGGTTREVLELTRGSTK